MSRAAAPTPDHIMYVAPDLDAAISDLEARTGVRAKYGGQHQGLGTHNALLDLGSRRYLEILAPMGPDSPALAPGGMLATMTKPRIFMWAVSCADIAATTEEAKAAGYEPGMVLDMSRALPTGNTLHWKLSVGGADVAGSVVPFCIQWEGEPHPSVDAPSGCEQVSLQALHPDPDRVRAALAALRVDLEVAVGDEPQLTLHMNTPKGEVILR